MSAEAGPQACMQQLAVHDKGGGKQLDWFQQLSHEACLNLADV